VKKITVAVSDEVYRNVRIHAAQNSTSISKIVAEYLSAISETAPDFTALELQQRRIQRSVKRFSASDRLKREEIYSRSDC
jgi:plasmid stability protein